MKIRVMLVDDHRMFRQALQASIANESDIEIVAEAGNAAQTLACLQTVVPDVMVLDIALPDMNGLRLAGEVLKKYPGIQIVALSGYAEKMFVDEMFKAGARAYVVKSAGADELLMAIRAVVNGHVFLSPEITSAMLTKHPEIPSGVSPALSVLAPRERGVLKLLAEGLTSIEIGQELGIAASTVDVHRRNIKKKLGLSSVAELTRYAVRSGLLAI